MTKRMLVDATHGEETRVAVVNGNRLEELDFEIASRKQLKGNIYLAKVIRVEPSLQAAFVEYGGNRHGFLAFSEIHPDYYRIPMEDRAALMAEEERLAAAEARRLDAMGGYDDEDEGSSPRGRGDDRRDSRAFAAADDRISEAAPASAHGAALADAIDGDAGSYDQAAEENAGGYIDGEILPPVDEFGLDSGIQPVDLPATEVASVDMAGTPQPAMPDMDDQFDVVGGDEDDDAPARRPRSLRSYKIQEVIKRRQILLIQVTKEERGNKGAALTTYLSLPGRYCVLMPNTGRGGGISRKITNPADRRRLKDILSDLEIPDGMAVILRTAGLERAKPEIKRDLEYLMRLWDDIRDQTLKSTAPALIYEEANLIKRAIRDVYSEDIEDVLVEGEGGFKIAQSFMKMMSPAHAGRVQLYRDQSVPLFHRYQVESQIDAIHSPVVQLRSGGYIVINPTEALVAIDVNSGRSTRERNIEETAYKTNMEAAEEVARQLRLRDLAGLIVIDFIDMEDSRNNIAVERKLKEAMKNDRARIQVGRISLFGLMELSRQRLRPSLQETNFERCPHCEGTGVVRSVESAALNVLRAIADEGIRRRAAELLVYVPTRVALYILNQKRADLSRLEARYGFRVAIANDDSLIGGETMRIERMRARTIEDDNAGLVSAERILEETDRELAQESDDADEPAVEAAEVGEVAASSDSEESERRRRRRRRRRGGRDSRDGEGRDSDGRDNGTELAAEAGEAGAGDEEGVEAGEEGAEGAEAEAAGEAAAGADAGAFERRGRRRRGRRGGRRDRGPQDEAALDGEQDGVEGELDGDALPAAASAVAAPVIRAVLPPAHAVQPLEPIDFDLILDGEEPVAAAPELTGGIAEAAPAEAAVGDSDAAAPVAAAEAEAPAKAKKPAKPRKRKAKGDDEDAGIDAPPASAEAVEASSEAAPAKPKRTRKTTKAAAEEAGTAEATAGEAGAGEAGAGEAGAGEAGESETAETKAKKPAKPRKRKTKGDDTDTGIDAPPASATDAAEAMTVDVTAEPEAAPAEPAAAEGEPVPSAATPPTPAPAPAAPGVNVVDVTAPPANPRRGWWSRS